MGKHNSLQELWYFQCRVPRGRA